MKHSMLLAEGTCPTWSNSDESGGRERAHFHRLCLISAPVKVIQFSKLERVEIGGTKGKAALLK